MKMLWNIIESVIQFEIKNTYVDIKNEIKEYMLCEGLKFFP